MGKTHWKNLANYNYLGAYSLEGIASEITATIKTIKSERVTAVGGKAEDCNVAYFEESEINGVIMKPMVLNPTNCKTIASIYKTPYVEDWVGKKITIFVTTTKLQRDIVPCLRIKNTAIQESVPQTVDKPVEQHNCVVCKKDMDARLYNQVMKAYNVSVCSKECYNKYLEEKGENK